MSQALFDKIESEQLRAEPLKFRVGDIVKVHTKVREGGKERVQVFQGIVLSIRGRGLNSTFTVRRISYGEGVEKIFDAIVTQELWRLGIWAWSLAGEQHYLTQEGRLGIWAWSLAGGRAILFEAG